MPHRKARAGMSGAVAFSAAAPFRHDREGGGMQVPAQPGHDWTAVLRRQPARIVDGQAEGGYHDVFEIVCCDCGDDPGLDYREVSPELQQIRGPYPIAAGVTAYESHVELHLRRTQRAGRAASHGGPATMPRPARA